MKIVITDGNAVNPGDLSWDFLNKYGQVVVYPRTQAEQAVERLQGADIILINKTPITAELLDACPTIKLICVTYHINQHWLETGEGEMYDMDSDNTAESLVPELVDILNANPALLRVVRSAARHMTAQDWERLNVFIELCAEDFIAARASQASEAPENEEK